MYCVYFGMGMFVTFCCCCCCCLETRVDGYSCRCCCYHKTVFEIVVNGTVAEAVKTSSYSEETLRKKTLFVVRLKVHCFFAVPSKGGCIGIKLLVSDTSGVTLTSSSSAFNSSYKSSFQRGWINSNSESGTGLVKSTSGQKGM